MYSRRERVTGSPLPSQPNPTHRRAAVANSFDKLADREIEARGLGAVNTAD
jgi:hypothetical protein